MNECNDHGHMTDQHIFEEHFSMRKTDFYNKIFTTTKKNCVNNNSSL